MLCFHICMQDFKILLSRAALQPFFDQRVKKVIVAAPVKDANPVLNIVFGCNEVGKSKLKKCF